MVQKGIFVLIFLQKCLIYPVFAFLFMKVAQVEEYFPPFFKLNPWKDVLYTFSFRLFWFWHYISHRRDENIVSLKSMEYEYTQKLPGNRNCICHPLMLIGCLTLASKVTGLRGQLAGVCFGNLYKYPMADNHIFIRIQIYFRVTFCCPFFSCFIFNKKMFHRNTYYFFNCASHQYNDFCKNNSFFSIC